MCKKIKNKKKSASNPRGLAGKNERAIYAYMLICLYAYMLICLYIGFFLLNAVKRLIFDSLELAVKRLERLILLA